MTLNIKEIFGSWVEERIVPWVELNRVGNLWAVDYIVAGLKCWLPLTKAAIVSTVPGGESNYTELLKRLPRQSMTIIPGIKTYTLLNTLDNINGWRNIAQECVKICNEAKSNVILIEMEAAQLPFLLGQQPCDFNKFIEGLNLLPKNLHYLCYPTIDNVHPVSIMRRRMLPYLNEINKVISPLWFSAGYSRPSSPLPTTWSTMSQESLKRFNVESYGLSGPLLFPIYCYGPETKWWSDSQVPYAVSCIPNGNIAVPYPGYVYWLRGSQSLTQLIMENKIGTN